jgi:arylsulfatase A
MTAFRLALLAVLLAIPIPVGWAEEQAARPPNVVIVFADDLGYADVNRFSPSARKPRPRTPNLDRMASEGVRLTSFYVAQAVCSASRAALLTGSYSNRVGITGALNHTATHGLNPDEITIAEVLKERGYATAMFGKWHLGHEPPFLPPRHGFDEYLGLPYSNDMWPRHPQQKNFYPDLPLIEGTEVVKLDPDQSAFTTQFTERAVRFIDKNKEKPFFLYLAHPMPHVPLFVSSRHQGATGQGLHGDVIAELDWSVGQVLDAIKAAKLDEHTLVIFTSDNGPWLSYGNHGGSAAPFREGKGTTFEGGVRVPFIARWTGRIPKGVVRDMPAMTIDLMPTVARLAGAGVPGDRVIDGRDIWPLLANQRNAASPHDALYFYWGRQLHAIRSGRWKLHLPHPYQALEAAGSNGMPGKYVTKQLELSLFDLDKDPGEATNVAAENAAVVALLMQHVERAREDLGDALTERAGKNLRPAGRLPPPLRGIYGGVPQEIIDSGTRLRDFGLDAVWLGAGSFTPERLALLRREGMKVYAEFNTLHVADYLKEHPDAAPIGADGRVSPPPQGWQGICPTHEAYRRFRMDAFRKLLQDFAIDGVWLDYHHSHASWERADPDMPDTCFCDRCLRRFQEATAIRLPDAPTSERAALLLSTHRQTWTRWRLSVFTDWVREFRAIIDATRPSALLGTFHNAWTDEDAGGARLEKLAIDLKAQAAFVDVFSPMVYHARFGHAADLEWISRQVAWLGDYLNVEGAPGERHRIWPIVQISDWGEPVPVAQVAPVLERGGRRPASGVIVFAWSGLRKQPEKIQAIGRAFRSMDAVGR